MRIAPLPLTRRPAVALALGDGIPGLDGRALGDFLHDGAGQGLLAVYDRLVGGNLSRGSLFALGVMPYLSAVLLLWIARRVVPGVAVRWAERATRRRLTRLHTLVLALVQSYGFARFAQQVPGAAAEPGAGFVVRTMLLLTAGALGMLWMAEQVTAGEHVAAPARGPALGGGRGVEPPVFASGPARRARRTPQPRAVTDPGRGHAPR